MTGDPFGRTSRPPDLDRAGRVALIRQAADDLVAGRLVDRPAALFLGGALLAWLRDGRRTGDLERRYLRTTPPAGSHATAQAIGRPREERQGDQVPADSRPSISERT